MSSVGQTIDQALRNIGAVPRDVLLETLENFELLGLSDEERVCAVATAVASSAMAFHNHHITKYFEAIRVWALEIAADRPAPPRLNVLPQRDRIASGAEILVAGLQGLVDALRDEKVALTDKLIAELTLFARLLGRHDAHTIHLTLASMASAIKGGGYRPGYLIAVPLRDPAPAGRDADLTLLDARGVA